MPEIEIRELTEAESECLKCPLFAPVCDGNDKGCRYVQIVRFPVKSPQQMAAWHSPESRAKAVEKRRLAFGWVRDATDWIAKPCGACGEVLPLGAFYGSTATEISGKCKPCHRRAADGYRNRGASA